MTSDSGPCYRGQVGAAVRTKVHWAADRYRAHARFFHQCHANMYQCQCDKDTGQGCLPNLQLCKFKRGSISLVLGTFSLTQGSTLRNFATGPGTCLIYPLDTCYLTLHKHLSWSLIYLCRTRAVTCEHAKVISDNAQNLACTEVLTKQWQSCLCECNVMIMSVVQELKTCHWLIIIFQLLTRLEKPCTSFDAWNVAQMLSDA